MLVCLSVYWFDLYFKVMGTNKTLTHTQKEAYISVKTHFGSVIVSMMIMADLCSYILPATIESFA